MRCVVCESSFFHTSWSAQGEPCDCGYCVPANNDLSREALAVLRVAFTMTDEQIAALRDRLSDEPETVALCEQALAGDPESRHEVAGVLQRMGRC